MLTKEHLEPTKVSGALFDYVTKGKSKRGKFSDYPDICSQTIIFF